MNDKLLTECPNPACQKGQTDFIAKINTLLFGLDENSGWAKKLKDLETCIRARVTKTWLIGTAITVVGILVVVFVPMISGAIKNIKQVSDLNIKLEERMTNTKEQLQTQDINHKLFVASMEDRNEAEHKTFVDMHTTDIATIKQELTTLISQSEERIKEHIDLTIKAYVKQTNGARTGIGKGTGP